MLPLVKRLIVKRFRSIPFADVMLDNPTFLVGQNGSGKSNFVDTFSFLSDAMVLPLQAVFDKRGGISAVRNRTSGKGGYPPNLGIFIEFGNVNGTIGGGNYAFEVKALPNYGFEVVWEQCFVGTNDGGTIAFERTKRKGFSATVKGIEPSLDPASLVLPVVGGDARFAPLVRAMAAMRVYAIEPGKLREMQDPDSGTNLRSDGGNAASVLQEIERHSKDDMERICQILASIVPNTTSVHTKKHGNKISLGFTQEWGGGRKLKFEAFNMSDGTLRALGLLTAVYQQPRPTLLAIEEPEATIHPGALGAVLDLIRHVSRQIQVIVTTHSPEVLDAKWIQDNNLRVVRWQEGATGIGPVSQAARQALQQHLMGAGELLRSNALEPDTQLEPQPDAHEPSLFENMP
jgi:predicted ATPase